MELEDYRKTKDLKYEELATRLGIKKSTVYNICNKRVKCVSLPNAHAIVSKTFGEVDYADLLWGDC